MTLSITTGESGIHISGDNSQAAQRHRLRERYRNDSRAKRPGRWSGSGFLLTRRLLAGLLVLAGLAPCPLPAQPNAPNAAPPSERCLLIVETSKSMQRRADAVLGVVRDMLMSGLNGEFRDGGTLGIWTFNEDLSAGRFPLQTWSSSAQKDITQRTLAFLKSQHYEKQASFDKVAPALGRVIRDSELITVILISSGDCKIRGTPFDDRINASCQQWYDQQQKARMPFVTVLRARNGHAGGYVVNTPPWPLQVPRLPEETKSAETIQARLLEALRNASTTTAPPLAVSAKKSQPEPAPSPKPEPVATRTEAPLPVAAVAITNAAAPVKPPVAAAPPAEVAKAAPAPVVPEKPATVAAPKPAPAPISSIEPKAETVKAPEAKKVEPAPAKPEPTPAAPAPKPKPEPAAIEQPKPAPTPAAKTEPAPTAPVAAATQPTPSRPASLATLPSPCLVAPAQSATAVPSESLLRTRNILVAALLLAIVAVAFTFLLMRRSRAAPQGSLITRSYERQKKL
jgi:nitrogen fixation protein